MDLKKLLLDDLFYSSLPVGFENIIYLQEISRQRKLIGNLLPAKIKDHMPSPEEVLGEENDTPYPPRLFMSIVYSIKAEPQHHLVSDPFNFSTSAELLSFSDAVLKEFCYFMEMLIPAMKNNHVAPESKSRHLNALRPLLNNHSYWEMHSITMIGRLSYYFSSID